MGVMENPENPENPENLENTVTSAMNIEIQTPCLIDALCVLRTTGVVSDEQFIRMMGTLQDENGVATMDSAPNDMVD
jgi:hypothetical protein